MYPSSLMENSPSVERCTEHKMNRHELQTIKQEAQRFTKGIKITEAAADALRLELPYVNAESEGLYFFVVKQGGSKKFVLVLPAVSVKIITDGITLSLLQPLLKTYGIQLSQDAIMTERS